MRFAGRCVKVGPCLSRLQLAKFGAFLLRHSSVLCFEFVSVFLHCALSLAAQCIVFGPVCVFVCVCVSLYVALFVGLLPR